MVACALTCTWLSYADFEDNNLHQPAYQIGGHIMSVFGEIILTGTSGEARGGVGGKALPWDLPYTFDAASKDYSCTDQMIHAGKCVVPCLESTLLGVSGATIEGNTFSANSATIFQDNYVRSSRHRIIIGTFVCMCVFAKLGVTGCGCTGTCRRSQHQPKPHGQAWSVDPRASSFLLA